MRWGGRILSLLMVALFLLSAAMKLKGGEKVSDGMEHLGIPMELLPLIAGLELVSVVLYAIPVTSILGAILLTGYLGGAILAHLRVGEDATVQIIIGLAVWIALFLREPRLRWLAPFRIRSDS